MEETLRIILSSYINFYIHRSSKMLNVSTQNSTFVDDRETTLCLLEFYETNEFPM